MRFKIGSRVEVLTKKKVSSGVWRCAVIEADNGDGYTVRFYRGPDMFKEGFDKVSAEAVRPCPPPLPVADSTGWAVDDVVEVLDGGYWKVSVIEEVLGDDCYQIHVIGSIDDFRVKKSNIRMRQELKDGKWVSLGKKAGNCEDMVTRMRKKVRMQQQGDFINAQPIAIKPSKSVKRSFADISSADEVYTECMQKRRAVNNEAKHKAIPEDMYSFVGCPDSRGILKQTQCSDNLLTSTVSCRNLGNASESKDCVSCSSSVASCSVIDRCCDRILSHTSTSCSQDSDSLCSDADSSYPLGDEEENSMGEQLGDFKTHELDLLTYRHTLEWLYASGPLTWDQEILLTDLRKELYVSNDEHLMELRRLRCAAGVALRCY
ncbi:hypothetical protein vseg_015346 [Gypsophila vaccaria]